MELKDVIHYYIGQRCFAEGYGTGFGKIEGATLSIVQIRTNMIWYVLPVEIKPILRRIEDLTEEEYKKWMVKVIKRTDEEDGLNFYSQTPESFHYLLSIGIDLFGLIDSGQAIDSKTLTP